MLSIPGSQSGGSKDAIKGVGAEGVYSAAFATLGLFGCVVQFAGGRA